MYVDLRGTHKRRQIYVPQHLEGESQEQFCCELALGLITPQTLANCHHHVSESSIAPSAKMETHATYSTLAPFLPKYSPATQGAAFQTYNDLLLSQRWADLLPLWRGRLRHQPHRVHLPRRVVHAGRLVGQVVADAAVEADSVHPERHSPGLLRREVDEPESPSPSHPTGMALYTKTIL